MSGRDIQVKQAGPGDNNWFTIGEAHEITQTSTVIEAVVNRNHMLKKLTQITKEIVSYFDRDGNRVDHKTKTRLKLAPPHHNEYFLDGDNLELLL